MKVSEFLSTIADPKRREDAVRLVELMNATTGKKPVMWGSSIVGFGEYHYRYASGREGDWFLAGFSPRKNDLTIYISGGLESHQASLAKLGKHKSRGSCLYVKKLTDIDLSVLRELLRESMALHTGKVTSATG